MATIVAAKALPELILPASALSMLGGSAAGLTTSAIASSSNAANASMVASTAGVAAGTAVGTSGIAISKGAVIAAAVILAVGSAVGVGIGITIANNNASAPVSAPVSFPAANDTSGTGDNSAGQQGTDEAPIQSQATPYLLIATDKNVIKRSLVDGTETEVLGNLQRCNNGSQRLEILSVSRYDRNTLGIWCDRKLYIFTEKGERLEINLATYVPSNYEARNIELSQDKSLLAFSIINIEGSSKSKLFVYNLKTSKAREYVGEYMAADGYPQQILPLYFSPDNSKLYAFPGVPAGYLTDRFFSFNLADGKYTQLKGFDISNAGQIVVADGNVDAAGNIYAWQSETGSAQDSLLKYDITTGKVLDKINLTTKIEAISPADTTTPFEGIDSRSQLAFFSAYSAACIDENILGGLVKCDKSKIGLVVFDLANKKILHDLRGKTDHYFGFSSLHLSGNQIYAFKANLNTERDAISSFTLQSFDLKTGVFKDIKTYDSKLADSILILLE